MAVRNDIDEHGMPFINLSQYEDYFERTMPQPGKTYWKWYADGKEHITRTREAYDNVYLKQRCLCPGVPTTTTTVFGDTVNPIGVSPSAFHKVAHEEAEVATARGVGKANGIYCYNYVYANKSIEEVAKEDGTKWLHMYLHDDYELLKTAFSKAEELNFSAVVVTVDHPHDRVKNATKPLFLSMNCMVPLDTPNCNDDFDTAKASWDMFEWYCKGTKLPVVAKGIMCVEDAEEAVRRGAKGIFVSGHGGRQFAYSPSTLEVLPYIVNAVSDKVDGNIFIDTAIRSGGDVTKALALGAKAAFVGRPVLYALHAGGDGAVADMIEILRYQLECNMQCIGAQSIPEITADVIARVAGPLSQVLSDTSSHTALRISYLSLFIGAVIGSIVTRSLQKRA
eukprot:TRINITY_DN1175_c1_g6_i1.p1 TRINITY_DN1175_c1_g6~~TRINITY_DN1175_c1_g6_i1.p1  ORF type:complete len:394 (+),score=70.96 TRINITY_DN1175_c1_g6_i1:46-1227(+)